MKILAIEKEEPQKKSVDFLPHLKAESLKVWELYRKGLIRELYFRKDIKAAVLILECDSVEQADKVLQTLPLVKQKLITFELLPLGPYTGFERLFSPHNSQIKHSH